MHKRYNQLTVPFKNILAVILQLRFIIMGHIFVNDANIS